MGELLDAVKEPLELPAPTRVAVMFLPPLTGIGPIKEALKRDPDAEELAVMEAQRNRRRIEATIQPSHAAAAPAKKPPAPNRPPPGSRLYVEYVKCKIVYTLEYRKDEAGSFFLYHADNDHLMEQLKPFTREQHKARMEAMHYTYNKWFKNE